ncbi:MAG TPA: pilin [Candidatus Paceibacterota bacterium]|nr:pilin [Candidatus Paceibacterota bacterium]
MRTLTVVFLIIYLALVSTSVLAQPSGGTGGASGGTGSGIVLPNPLGESTNTVADLIYKIIRWLIVASAPLASLMIIFGAYQMLFAGGSPEKFETGKKTILYTVIGFIIIALALGVAAIIRDVLGVSGGS